MWTWWGGGNTPQSYGTLDVSVAGNMPRGRQNTAVAFHPRTGLLYMFGGYPCYNDLWTWDLSTGFWTWIGGSSSTGQSGAYGSVRAADPGNVPGCRYAHAMAIHGQTGNLFVLAGKIIRRCRNSTICGCGARLAAGGHGRPGAFRPERPQLGRWA